MFAQEDGKDRLAEYKYESYQENKTDKSHDPPESKYMGMGITEEIIIASFDVIWSLLVEKIHHPEKYRAVKDVAVEHSEGKWVRYMYLIPMDLVMSEEIVVDEQEHSIRFVDKKNLDLEIVNVVEKTDESNKQRVVFFKQNRETGVKIVSPELIWTFKSDMYFLKRRAEQKMAKPAHEREPSYGQVLLFDSDARDVSHDEKSSVGSQPESTRRVNDMSYEAIQSLMKDKPNLRVQMQEEVFRIMDSYEWSEITKGMVVELVGNALGVKLEPEWQRFVKITIMRIIDGRLRMEHFAGVTEKKSDNAQELSSVGSGTGYHSRNVSYGGMADQPEEAFDAQIRELFDREILQPSNEGIRDYFSVGTINTGSESDHMAKQNSDGPKGMKKTHERELSTSCQSVTFTPKSDQMAKQNSDGSTGKEKTLCSWGGTTEHRPEKDEPFDEPATHAHEQAKQEPKLRIELRNLGGSSDEEKGSSKKPESEKLSTLFQELRIKKYLNNFKREEYLFEDLSELSSDCLDELIPKAGPRRRLKRWIASRRLKKSSFSKPLLKSLRSNSKTKKLFTDNFRCSLLSHCNAHAETKSAMALVEEQKTYILELIKNQKTGTNSNYEAFLSHVQKDSADLCRSIYLSLLMNDVKVWYDKEADRLDNRGMVEGIFKSNEFVFVMVKDFFERPYCIFEVLLAVALRKPITVLLENDRRFGGLAFEELSKVIPNFIYDHIIEHEIINVNREYFMSFVDKLKKRVTRHRKTKN
jgi:hypothetical protein